MHGRLWCPGVYGSRYQYARVHARTPVSCENYTRAHIGRRQVIMRDRRYDPILIVRIECGYGCCCCCCIRTGEGTQTALPGLHRSFEAICTIYDTREYVRVVDLTSPVPSRSSSRRRSRIKLAKTFFRRITRTALRRDVILERDTIENGRLFW